MWLIALNVVTILATLYPWDLGSPADPLTPTPVGIHPEWYFMAQFQALKVIGRMVPGLSGRNSGHGAVRRRADLLGRDSVVRS